jgi:glycolate oxidase
MESTLADRYTVDRPELVTRLRAVLPTNALLAEEEAMRPYDCDGLTAFRQLPLLVALPENEAQAQAILRICHDCGRRWWRAAPRPVSRAVRRRIRTGCWCRWPSSRRSSAVDPLSRTAVVQPGVRNLAVSEAAAPYGLYYAPDPSSQIACTIGGNVAENAGGVHCLKYGLTVHNVLRVRGLTSPARSSSSATRRSTRRVTTCWRCSTARKGCWR